MQVPAFETQKLIQTHTKIDISPLNMLLDFTFVVEILREDIINSLKVLQIIVKTTKK